MLLADFSPFHFLMIFISFAYALIQNMFDFAPPWYSDEELGVCGGKGGTGEGCGGVGVLLSVWWSGRIHKQSALGQRGTKPNKSRQFLILGANVATILFNNLAINPISCKTETNLVFGCFVAV